MRVFIAVDVSEEIKLKAHKAQEAVDRLSLDIKYIELHNLHFTLRFIGEVSEGDVNTIQKAMLNVAGQFLPFALSIKGVTAFPKPTFARIITCNVQEGKETLTALANTLSKELAVLGFHEEERPFEAHLTIGRLKSPISKPELITALKELENKDLGHMTVENIKLVQSTLTKQGPIYKDLFAAKLG